MIAALFVLAISTCPRLPPAASAPQNALDIRPDQVQVVAAVRRVVKPPPSPPTSCTRLHLFIRLALTLYPDTFNLQLGDSLTNGFALQNDPVEHRGAR